MINALIAATLVALCSLLGALIFGNNKKLIGGERYVVPAAVGVFLSLVLFELIPETLAANELWGGIVVAAGFISFYTLSYILHDYFHRKAEEDCERKGAATLLLIGDGVHNLADGVILGAAFLVNPAVGIATAIGLALHEIPQEIVEFGVLIRAGYSRGEAAVRNLFSASTIVVGTIGTLLLAEYAEGSMWIITGFAAGNLLYLAASDLLPRVHDTVHKYGSFWYATIAIVLGFAVMTSVLIWTHETFGHGHVEQAEHHKHTEDVHTPGEAHEHAH